MKKYYTCFISIVIVLANITFAQISKRGFFIFEPDKVKHGHTHASGIIECPNGDLLACWYEGESDRSTDVHIQAARWIKGETHWSETFLLADTPTLSDNNPCLFIDEQERLWLFYYTLLGSPEDAWDTAFLRYKISTEYQDAAKPIKWDIQRDLPVKPTDLDETIKKLCMEEFVKSDPDRKEMCEMAPALLKNQLARKLGWTTRVRPITLSSGTILLPMASEIFGIVAMALTSDGGETWQFSKSPLGYGVEQPSVLERKDGTLVAFMRDASSANRIRKSESKDQGLSWSLIVNTDLPNPGSGLEMIRLASGNIALIYNDCVNDPRNSLAVSMSEDEGDTWKWTRHLEQGEKYGRYDYPAMIQTRDGKIHATYSYNLKTIKHVIFTEDWIREGD